MFLFQHQLIQPSFLFSPRPATFAVPDSERILLQQTADMLHAEAPQLRDLFGGESCRLFCDGRLELFDSTDCFLFGVEPHPFCPNTM
jgi:hypothetical protein